MPGTLLLSDADLERLLEPQALLEALRHAMIAYSANGGPRAQRSHSGIPADAPHSVMLVFPGVVPGIPAFTVKINSKRPYATPSVRGLIALIDAENGALLAVMDSIVITRLRTALVGALAAQAMARETITTVAVIGAGVQGRVQLRALRLVRQFGTVRVYDAVPAHADALVAELHGELNASMSVAQDVRSAVAGADVVIVATWAKSPVLFADMVAPGAHITAIGADEPGKAELDAELIRRSRFVCDDADLAVSMGALAGVGLGPECIHATLGDVLAGRRPGRVTATAITIFGSVGLPCQDLPAAWMAYGKAATAPASTFRFHGA